MAPRPAPHRALRPVDLAREHGLSGQAVRNYEAAGILPPAERTAAGYRAYTPRHARALRAFRGLVPGFGHATATAVLVAVNDGRVAEALALLDRGHATLHADRELLDAVERAVAELTGPSDRDGAARTAPGTAGRSRRAPSLPGPTRPAAAPPEPARDLGIGPLAHRLGLRPATLRRWERAGLLHPTRADGTGHRTYGPVDVRDAHLVHQLRRGGYPLAAIAPLLDDLRGSGGPDAAAAALADRRSSLDARARAMLGGAAALHALLNDPDEASP